MLLWAAKITTVSAQVNSTTPALYYLMNFNDFFMSLVTLFHIMVVNNWYVTCNMYCLVSGSSWPILYFVSFWTSTVFIMLNLVIAFVIDIYESTENETQAEFKRRDYVLKLRQQFQAISINDQAFQITQPQNLADIPEEVESSSLSDKPNLLMDLQLDIAKEDALAES